MIARKLRTLRPGTEYNRLITPSLGGYLVRLDNADTADTLKLIQEVIKKTLAQTKLLAPTLRGINLNDTCRNIWNFVYHHIQYAEDRRGHEEIRHPSRIWADRITGVDCDDYTVMISSILTHLGIPHKLRMTDYGTGKGWQHIYVVVPKDGNAQAALSQANRTSYITLDCVTDRFDHEVHYLKNQDTAMTLNELDGLPAHRPHRSRSSRQVNGLGNYDQTGEMGNIFKKIGNAFKSVAKAVKKVATTPIRLGILAAMKLNFPKGADKYRFGYIPYGPIVAKAGYGPEAHKKFVTSLKKLIKVFVGLGGDHNVLFRTILNSKGNKDKAVPVDIPNPEGQEGFHGLGGLGRVVNNGDMDALEQITSTQSRVVGVSGLEGLAGEVNGLGELGIVAETIIAAASAVLLPIIKMMSGAKANDPGDPVPDEYAPEEEETPDPDADPATATTTEGLGALKKKAAKKRVTAVATRQVAKGKPISANAQKAVTKAKKPATKTAKPGHKPPVVSHPATRKPTDSATTHPHRAPGVATPSTTEAHPVTSKKKKKTSPQTATRKKKKPLSPQDKLATKKKIKENTERIQAAKVAGDQTTADQLKQETVQLVQQANEPDTVQVDTQPSSDNTGVVRKPRETVGEEDWRYMDPTGEASGEQIAPTAKVDAAARVLNQTKKAVDKGLVTVQQGKEIYDKTSAIIQATTGKSLPGASPATTTTDDGQYDSHTVVDSKVLPADDGSTDTTTDLVPTTPGSSTQSSMGTMIGIGVGALLLGSLLLGNSAGQAAIRTRAVHGLAGLPKKKTTKKATKSASRKRKVPSRVPLQD